MRRFVGPALGVALALGCAPAERYDQAVAVLIDVSGTYADRRPEAVQVVKREILPSLVPGDSLVVIRIDSQSYQRENVEALLTLDPSPSRANAQKLALARRLDDFATRELRSSHTDIPGAMMLAAEYLRELGGGSRVMLIFSDMQEDLPRGSVRRLGENEFEGIRIVAMNVKRLAPDGSDPDRFRARLHDWEQRVRTAHALDWRSFLDASKLAAYLETVR